MSSGRFISQLHDYLIKLQLLSSRYTNNENQNIPYTTARDTSATLASSTVLNMCQPHYVVTYYRTCGHQVNNRNNRTSEWCSNATSTYNQGNTYYYQCANTVLTIQERTIQVDQVCPSCRRRQQQQQQQRRAR